MLLATNTAQSSTVDLPQLDPIPYPGLPYVEQARSRRVSVLLDEILDSEDDVADMCLTFLESLEPANPQLLEVPADLWPHAALAAAVRAAAAADSPAVGLWWRSPESRRSSGTRRC